MYNASRASRPIRALNGDFSFNARVLTNRAALASRPFVVVADRFDSKETGESVGGCCSPTNWFGRSLAWARLRTRVNTNTPCMCASAASTFTRFFCAQPRPQHACLHRVCVPAVFLSRKLYRTGFRIWKLGGAGWSYSNLRLLNLNCIRTKTRGRSFKFERK